MNYTALTQADFAVLQLALDVLNADTARKQKAALKRRDDTALERLAKVGDDAIAARRKLFEMQGSAKVNEPTGLRKQPGGSNHGQ